MADIFLSYAGEDRERAAGLAETLAAFGWEVWWDRELVVGDRFSAVIAEQLAGASCVIVLWSQRSVASGWVADEANAANDRGVYLPVLIDDTQPPLGLRSAQYADLSAWDGSHDHREFRRLIDGIRRHVGKAPVALPPKGFWRRLGDALGRKRRRALGLTVAALPLAALAISLTALGASSTPAQVRVELTVSRATVTFREVVDRGVVSSYPTATLTVVDFQEADLGFAEAGSAEPSLGPGRVRLSAADPPASVTFYDVQSEGVRLPAGSPVTFGWLDSSLTLTARDTSLAVSFSARPRLTLSCEGCAVASGEQDPVPLTASTRYTVAFAAAQIATVQSVSPGMSLTLDAPVGSVPMAGNIRVERVEFLEIDDAGRPASSIRSGRLEYPLLGRPAREVRGGEFVVAESLEDFYLTRVAVVAEGLQLELHGQAGHLEVGGAGAIQSQLPSRLEALMSRSPWLVYTGGALGLGILAGGILGVGRRGSQA